MKLTLGHRLEVMEHLNQEYDFEYSKKKPIILTIEIFECHQAQRPI